MRIRRDEIIVAVSAAVVWIVGLSIHARLSLGESKAERIYATNATNALDGPTNTWKTNSTDYVSFVITNMPAVTGRRLKTLTNECYVSLPDGSILVRLSDEDWQAITNCYRNRLQTNNIEIWCP